MTVKNTKHHSNYKIRKKHKGRNSRNFTQRQNEKCELKFERECSRFDIFVQLKLVLKYIQQISFREINSLFNLVYLLRRYFRFLINE